MYFDCSAKDTVRFGINELEARNRSLRFLGSNVEIVHKYVFHFNAAKPQAFLRFDLSFPPPSEPMAKLDVQVVSVRLFGAYKTWVC